MALAVSGASGRHLASCRFDMLWSPPVCVLPLVKNPTDDRGAVASSSSAESTTGAIRILLFNLLGVTIPDDDGDDRIFVILRGGLLCDGT
jgi:hypothetical protein